MAEAGGAREQAERFVRHSAEVYEVSGEDTLSAEARAVDGLNLRVLFRLAHSAEQGAVYHGGGAAAVGDEHIAF